MLKFDWNILFALINLVIFYLLMKRFLFKPILGVMNKRKELINKQFQDADAAKDEALELKKQYEGKLQNVNEETNRIISQAKEDAQNEYGKIMNAAEADAQKMKEEAKKQIEIESEKAFRSAKENIATLVIDAASKVVGSNVDAKTDSDIFDEFLNEGSDK